MPESVWVAVYLWAAVGPVFAEQEARVFAVVAQGFPVVKLGSKVVRIFVSRQQQGAQGKRESGCQRASPAQILMCAKAFSAASTVNRWAFLGSEIILKVLRVLAEIFGWEARTRSTFLATFALLNTRTSPPGDAAVPGETCCLNAEVVMRKCGSGA